MVDIVVDSGSDVGSLLLVFSVISMSGSGHFEEFVGRVPGTVQLNFPVVMYKCMLSNNDYIATVNTICDVCLTNHFEEETSTLWWSFTRTRQIHTI